ncbi:MAG: gamma-glutamyl-phosphate reductase, partial [Candidatus Fonsibacter sp.]
ELVRRVAAEARMPMLKHFTGNWHVYVDSAADLATALAIVVNAKCQRIMAYWRTNHNKTTSLGRAGT